MSLPPETTKTIHVPCPRCERRDATHIVIASETVLTLKCATCVHMWSIELTSLPESVRSKIA